LIKTHSVYKIKRLFVIPEIEFVTRIILRNPFDNDLKSI